MRILDPDLILPEPPAKLFRCQGKVQLPPGKWNVVTTLLVPIKEGSRLLGFARTELSEPGFLGLHLVFDYESITRLDLQIGKAVFPFPVWMIDEEVDGAHTVRLMELLMSNTPAYPGQTQLSGEIL